MFLLSPEQITLWIFFKAKVYIYYARVLFAVEDKFRYESNDIEFCPGPGLCSGKTRALCIVVS